MCKNVWKDNFYSISITNDIIRELSTENRRISDDKFALKISIFENEISSEYLKVQNKLSIILPYIVPRLGDFNYTHDRYTTTEQKIIDWCEKNFIGRYCHGFMFGIRCEYEEDAISLKLRWK